MFKINVFHEKWWNSHDSRGGTDTPGPGESVSAIQGPQKSQENQKITLVFSNLFDNFQKFWKESLYASYIKICNLCTPPLAWPV